jgi:hypothetical protein
MRKITSAFLVFTLLCLSGIVFGKESRGTMLIVHKKNGQIIRGELIAVKRNSLLLLESESGRDVSIPNNSINVLEKGVVKGAVIGFLIGAGVGLALGLVWNSSTSDNDSDSFIDFNFNISPWQSALGLGVVGALLGAAIGAKSNQSEVVILEGKSQAERNAIFRELRSEARVPNYQ